MAIETVLYSKQKPGTRWSSKHGAFVGFRIDKRVAGRRHREGPFPTKAAADDFIYRLITQARERKAGLKHVETAEISLQQLIDARLASLTEVKRLQLCKRVLGRFAAIAGRNTRVVDIRTSHLRQYTEARREDLTSRGTAVTSATVDRELGVITGTLNAAREYFDGLLDHVAPASPKLKVRKSRRERVITDREREKWITETRRISPEIGSILEFAFLTALRHSEIMRIHKSDLDRGARSLKVYRSKTDTTSYISPLTDRMLELLDFEYETGYIFTRDGKTPPLFYEVLKDAAEASSIPYGRYTPGGIILHDTRHTWITRMLQAGVDIATIQSFTGHSSKEMVMHYSHARPESRRRAMEVTETFGDAKEKGLESVNFQSPIASPISLEMETQRNESYNQ